MHIPPKFIHTRREALTIRHGISADLAPFWRREPVRSKRPLPREPPPGSGRRSSRSAIGSTCSRRIEGGHAIAEVAQLLGFTGASAFHRAIELTAVRRTIAAR